MLYIWPTHKDVDLIIIFNISIILAHIEIYCSFFYVIRFPLFIIWNTSTLVAFFFFFAEWLMKVKLVAKVQTVQTDVK
jgi:hypothetical protein